MRFLLYSHDSWGLGHLKRSLTIAGALTSRFEGANVMIVTGSPCATQFELPVNCDVLKLPSISKDAEGDYVSRSFSADVAATVQLRSRLILEAYRAFQPHLVLVDHQLTGLRSEALRMLREARREGRKTIYGMRDVMDSAEAVRAEWASHDCHWALKCGYDRICVYGRPEVFDPRSQYPILSAHRHKIEFSGYIVAPLNGATREPVTSLQPTVLVTLGGGEDGAQRIDAYLAALAIRPAAWNSRIIAGPLMDPARVRQFKRQVHSMGLAEQVKISRFHANIPRLLQSADAVVAMAGYNSCMEIVQSRIPAVFLARSFPRKEQLIRARRFQEIGIGTCLEELDPTKLRAAVEQALVPASKKAKMPKLPLNGTDGLCAIVASLLTGPRHAAARPRLAAGVSLPD